VRDYQPSKVDLVGVDTTEAITALPTMDEIERRYIRQVLGAVAGNKTLAAQILGFDRRTLYRKLDRMNESTAGVRLGQNGDGSKTSPAPS
jgi:DNA-binding NtrC family response regulator